MVRRAKPGTRSGAGACSLTGVRFGPASESCGQASLSMGSAFTGGCTVRGVRGREARLLPTRSIAAAAAIVHPYGPAFGGDDQTFMEHTADVIGNASVSPVRIRGRAGSASRPVVQLGIGMAVILGALAFLAYQGLSNNLVYYITPSELLARGPAGQGQEVRLGGQVRPGSQVWNRRTHVLTFVLQDPRGHVRVTSSSLPPPLFGSGIGAVVQGYYRSGTFHASSLLVKHSSDYVAPKPGQLPKPDQFVHR